MPSFHKLTRIPMQLLTLLSQKLDDDAKNAMAQAIQATPAELEKGLNQLSRLFLGVLVHPPLNRIQVENIQKVVEEGGHTGELLSNLPSLLADEQRSTLLVDIGTKIFQHFYEGDTETLIEKLTMVLGIRKSVVQAILGLTPPLVLGAIGTLMRKERWDTFELQSYLENQQKEVEEELSPYLTPHITSRNVPVDVPEEAKVMNAKNQKKAPKKKTSFRFFLWLPWILLGLLVAASWWYLRTLQKGDVEANPLTDSLSVLSDDANFDQIEERMNQPVDTNVAIPTPVSPTPEEKIKEESRAIQPTRETSQAERPVSEAKKSAPKATDNLRETSTTPTPKANTPLRQTSNVSSALRSMFQSGSAEIKDDQALKSLVDTWKATKSSTFIIEGNLANRLTEDQAYAMRERLFQLGVPISSIRLEKSNSALQISLK